MAGNRIKGITIEIGGDATPLQKALSGVDKSLRNTQSALKDVNKLLKLDPKNVNLLKQKQDLLKKAIEDTKKKLDTEKEALEQLKKKDSTPEVEEQMRRLERQIAEDEQALKDLQKEAKNFGSVAKQQMKQAGESIQDFGKKLDNVGKGFSAVGDTLTKNVTAPIVAAGAAGVAAFNELDDAYDIIIKKTGATGDQLAEMKSIMEDIATSIPTDFNLAAEAVGEVNTRFGLTGDELKELSTLFVKFAEINDTTVTASIDAVQAAMAAFGLEAEDAADVLDILTKAAQDTGTPIDKLTQLLLTNGTALQEMGFGINTAVGFLANLEKNGVDSSTVLAGLKKALQNAAKEGKPLAEALQELQDKMAGAKDDTEATQIAIELFGSKAGPAIANAVRDGRLSFDELSNAVTNFGDAVDNTYNETLDPLDSWKTTLNTIKTALAELGGVVGEIVAPVLVEVTDAVKDLKDKWDSLNPETQDFIVKAAMIAAVVGPIVSIIGGLISGIAGLIVSIGIIVSTLAPVAPAFAAVAAVLTGPVAIAIAAVIAAAALLVTHWDQVKDAFHQMGQGLKKDWETLKGIITGVVDAIKTSIVNNFNTVKNTVSNVVSSVQSTVSAKFNAVKSTVTSVVSTVTSTVTSKFNAIRSTVSTVAGSIQSTVSAKFNAVKTAITKPIESAKSTISSAIGKIKSIINGAKLSLPHFKLPHFVISGGKIPWGIGGVGVKPTISVRWYKKAYDNPVIFSQPTVLPTLQGLKGFGDGSGSEIVMSLNKLQELVGQQSAPVYMTINAAPGMNVQELADEVQRRMMLAQRAKNAVYA